MFIPSQITTTNGQLADNFTSTSCRSTSQSRWFSVNKIPIGLNWFPIRVVSSPAMIKHSALALSGLLLAVWISFSSAAFDVMYEKFEQFNGSEVCSLKSMRVRKFNRTTSVLDGVMDLKQEADNNYEVIINSLLYSSIKPSNDLSPFRYP